MGELIHSFIHSIMHISALDTWFCGQLDAPLDEIILVLLYLHYTAQSFQMSFTIAADEYIHRSSHATRQLDMCYSYR